MGALTELEAYYRALGDDAFMEEFAQGPSVFEPQVWKMLQAEARRRNLALPIDTPQATDAQRLSRIEIGMLRDELAKAERGSWLGRIIAFVGTVVTIVTFFTGDKVIVAWGAIVFGSLRAVSSDSAARKIKRLLEEASERESTSKGDAQGDAANSQRSPLEQLDDEFAALERDGRVTARIRQSYERQRAALVKAGSATS